MDTEARLRECLEEIRSKCAQVLDSYESGSLTGRAGHLLSKFADEILEEIEWYVD